MLDHITPVILTFNEAPNIGRTLERLDWAREIVVVDSFSDDDTLSIVRRIPQARIFQRDFDCLANQWNFALAETGIRSEWVLALDADYVLTLELVEELRNLEPGNSTFGYRANFVYCVNGRRLRGSAYPPVTVLYRHAGSLYRQDGHAHRVVVNGPVKQLCGRVLHDDRKSIGHWLQSQDKYMRLEMQKLIRSRWDELGWADRLRKLRVVAPFAMFFYCLFVKGAVLDGSAGLYYAFQRMLSEALLSIHLFERQLVSIQAANEEEQPAEPISAGRSQ